MLENETSKLIQNEIDNSDIVLFMKGTPVMPQCGFSANIVGVLTHLGAKFKSINVLEDNKIREGIKIFSDWPTIPQLYIRGEFIGGCDIVREMYENGELSDLIKEKTGN